MLGFAEDVGRHNAVDKVIGEAFASGCLPLSNHILFVSGRPWFEIVQKAVVAAIPIVAAVSAPSSLAMSSRAKPTSRSWGSSAVTVSISTPSRHASRSSQAFLPTDHTGATAAHPVTSTCIR